MVFGLHEYRATNLYTWILFPVNFGDFAHSSVHNTGSITSQYVAFASSLCAYHGVEASVLENERFDLMSSPRMSFRNHRPNSVLLKDLSLYVIGLRSRMYWQRIAAAATAAFWGGQNLPASWRQQFPDARLKIHLRFNVVRILWALLVKVHGRLWRFATHIIEVIFLFAQWWTVILYPRLIRIHFRHSEIFNDGTCTGGWFLNSLSQLFIGDNPSTTSLMIVPIYIFIISNLENALANILRDVLVLLDVADVHQCNKVDFPYLLFLCAFFMTSFDSFSIVVLHLNSTWLGVKDLLFVLLDFPRHASLRDRSPESSEPYVTLDSRRSLIRTTFEVHTFSFPGSHLRAPRTLLVFLFTWRIFVSQIRCAARPDNMWLLSPSEKIKWRDFLKMLWLLQSSHRVLYFLSEEFHSTIYELYGSIWWR